jgi:hypothetical protein
LLVLAVLITAVDLLSRLDIGLFQEKEALDHGDSNDRNRNEVG